jgi:hypothetical protein
MSAARKFDPRRAREFVEQYPAKASVARKLETSVEAIDVYSRAVCWFSDGRIQLDDGRILTKAELDALVKAGQ